MRGVDAARSIDWSDWGDVHQTVSCLCGADYRSHAKVTEGGHLVAQQACPGCGKHDDLWRARADPEQMLR